MPETDNSNNLPPDEQENPEDDLETEPEEQQEPDEEVEDTDEPEPGAAEAEAPDDWKLVSDVEDFAPPQPVVPAVQAQAPYVPPAPQPTIQRPQPEPEEDGFDPSEPMTHGEWRKLQQEREAKLHAEWNQREQQRQQQFTFQAQIDRAKSLMEAELDKYQYTGQGKRANRAAARAMIVEELSQVPGWWLTADQHLPKSVKRAVKQILLENRPGIAPTPAKSQATGPVKQTGATPPPKTKSGGVNLLDSAARAREIRRLTGIKV